jgi:hypothetical protein
MATWRSSGSQSGWTGIDSKEHNPSCQFVPDRSILARESSRYVRPLRHGTGWWPCSSGSTSLEGNHLKGYRGGILRGTTSSMGSSMSHPLNRRSPTLFAFSGRESSRRASHLLLTKLGEQYRRVYGRNLVGEQKSGAHNVVGCARCKFLHREESMPVLDLVFVLRYNVASQTHPHCGMQSSRYLVVLLQPRTATKYFWQPKLSDSPLHMPNLSLRGGRCLHPL